MPALQPASLGGMSKWMRSAPPDAFARDIAPGKVQSPAAAAQAVKFETAVVSTTKVDALAAVAIASPTDIPIDTRILVLAPPRRCE